MVRSDSNTAEHFTQYQSILDEESIIIPTGPIELKPMPIGVIKKPINVIMLGGIVFLVLFIIFIIGLMTNWFQWTGFSNKLIEKYENKANSQFTNKDQVDFNQDYDINYLVEQMIYKEFSPKDKKKYLNLPEALKDSLLKDYLIEKI